jgi:hypothetical protein
MFVIKWSKNQGNQVKGFVEAYDRTATGQATSMTLEKLLALQLYTNPTAATVLRVRHIYIALVTEH